jgi:hypothetical protein
MRICSKYSEITVYDEVNQDVFMMSKHFYIRFFVDSCGGGSVVKKRSCTNPKPQVKHNL